MNQFYSETLQKAIQLLYFQADKEKYPEGVRLLEEAVTFGEADAYYFLSRCYAWGDGAVQENSKKARQYVKDGIEKGSALCVLGADRMSALNGDILPVMTLTLEQAFEKVKKMAEGGEPMAQYAVGLFYFWGDMLMGIQKPSQKDFDKYEKANGKESLKWFCASAEQGCIPAFRNAFYSQYNGQNGVEKSLKNALRVAEKLKDKLDLTDYYYDIGLEYKNQSEYKDTIRWYELGIKKGCSYCMTGMGLLYLDGTGVKEDDAKALDLFKKAAEQGEEYGIYNVGRCYYKGWGTQKDYETAFSYFQKAAAKSVQSAEYYLAECYYNGHGTNEDPLKAFTYSLKASRNEISNAGVLLGKCYLYGKGTDVNYEKAKETFKKFAEEQGNAEAYRNIGVMYDQGLGMPESIEAAVVFYQKAAEAGSQAAKEDLARFKKGILGKWKRR